MQVEAVIPLADGAEAEFRKLMGSFLQNTTDNNATFQALNEYFTWSDAYAQAASVPFSSDRKWSAITFAHGVTFVVGAPEKLCPSELPEQLRAHMQAGKRILLAGITQETVSKQERCRRSSCSLPLPLWIPSGKCPYCHGIFPAARALR